MLSGFLKHFLGLNHRADPFYFYKRISVIERVGEGRGGEGPRMPVTPFHSLGKTKKNSNMYIRANQLSHEKLVTLFAFVRNNRLSIANFPKLKLWRLPALINDPFPPSPTHGKTCNCDSWT